jgi:hypothetical protein
MPFCVGRVSVCFISSFAFDHQCSLLHSIVSLLVSCALPAPTCTMAFLVLLVSFWLHACARRLHLSVLCCCGQRGRE